jgi:Amt family ammonium transporter
MPLILQTVFAATAATIVSGAERTKFDLFDILLVLILLIYPISGSWVWNAGGWLAKMGFTDCRFKCSTSVGGWSIIVATALVGPRIGKYNTDGTEMQYLDTI